MNSDKLFNECVGNRFGELQSLIAKIAINRGIEYDRDDVVQNTFIAMYKSMCQYDPGKGTLRSWVGAIARNQSNLYWRKKLIRKETDLKDCCVDNCLDDVIYADQRKSQLDKAISQLPMHQRLIVNMRLAGKSYQDICKQTYLSESCAKTRMHRAINNLRKVMPYG